MPTFWTCLEEARCRIWRIRPLRPSGSKSSCKRNATKAVCWTVSWTPRANWQHSRHDDRWSRECCRVSKNELRRDLGMLPPRRRHVARADLRKYGVTMGCASCSVDRHTYRVPHFLMHSCCTDVSLLVVRVYSHTLTSMHLHGSSHDAHCLRFAQKHSHLILVAQCRTPCRTLTPRTGTPSSPFPESVFNSILNKPAKINGHSRVCPLMEFPPLTGYEPNRIAEDRDYRHFTADCLFTEARGFTCQTLVLPPVNHSINL